MSPVPRAAWPRNVEFHKAPSGPGTPSSFGRWAIAWADAGGEGAEDAADDLGLSLVDGALAADRLAPRVGAPRDVVAVAEAAAGLALLHPAADAAMGFRREVLQEEGIHRAFQANVQLTDLALAQGDDLHAREAQMLEQRRDVGLVAAHAVQSLGEHDLEPAALRVLQQRLNAGSEYHAGAGDGGVMVRADDFPLLARRMFAADAELVVDRGDALIVGGIAGVERNPGHRVISWRSVLAPLRRVIVVRGLQPLERISRYLPADQAGDRQHRCVDPGPRVPVAVVVRRRGGPPSSRAWGPAARSSSSIIVALVRRDSC